MATEYGNPCDLTPAEQQRMELIGSFHKTGGSLAIDAALRMTAQTTPTPAVSHNPEINVEILPTTEF